MTEADLRCGLMEFTHDSPPAENDAGMETTRNASLLSVAFDRLAVGDGSVFIDLMAEDFSWTITGGSWAGTWHGKRSVCQDLLAPLLAQFADRYTSTAERIIAAGDWVVVECRGHVMTTGGDRYANAYCYLCRFSGGLLRELREYCDTELIASVLHPPQRNPTVDAPSRP